MYVTWCILGISFYDVNLDAKVQYSARWIEDLATTFCKKIANDEDSGRCTERTVLLTTRFL